MALKGIYVDDIDPEDNAELLSSKAIKFDAEKRIFGISKMTSTILAKSPDVLVLDYRLDLNKSDADAENDYRAGPLAQAVRAKVLDDPKSDFPIILVSSEENIIKYFNPDKTSHDLFDECYRKESLRKDDRIDGIVNQIVSLAEGYKTIFKHLQTEHAAFNILSLSEDEDYVLKGTDIPNEIKEAQAPHIISRIILTKLIKNTGLLLRPYDIAARLGINLSQNAEENEEIFAFFEEIGCQYDGVYSGGWRRFWRHKFEAWSEDLFGKPMTSIPGDERVEKLNKSLGWKLVPAKSTWSSSNKELFSFACACCYRPAELKHSVSVHDDVALRYLEKKRICYDCVQTGKYEELAKPLRVSSEDAAIAKDLETKKRPTKT